MTTETKVVPAWFDEWEQDVLHGSPPELWPCGKGFESVEIGPELVMLLGGAPGAGKTALAMQLVIDALRLNESLRVFVASVEMSRKLLLNRQLSRLSGVDAGWVCLRQLTGQETRIRAGLDTLRGISDRIEFHTGSPTLMDVAQKASAFGARLLVLDYVQRLTVGVGEAQEQRAEMNSLMNVIRRVADSGLGVLVVSAVARQKSRTGSDYNGLGLASFRGSSELEYGADSAWILSGEEEALTFKCVKNRHGRTPELELHFLRARQTFTAKPNLTDQVKSYFAGVDLQTQAPPGQDAFDLGGEGYAEDDVPFD